MILIWFYLSKPADSWNLIPLLLNYFWTGEILRDENFFARLSKDKSGFQDSVQPVGSRGESGLSFFRLKTMSYQPVCF
jgi:hypothetical protein